MCRMAGTVFRRRYPRVVLADLKEVGQHGRVPGERALGHPHGWGIVSFAGGDPYYIARSTEPVYQDASFAGAMAAVEAIPPPNIVLAHVRHASTGVTKTENTHPFIVDGIALAHNGTVPGLRAPAGRFPKGETDSERLAVILANLYEEKRGLRMAMKALVNEVIRPKEFTAAIILASDGVTLAGYRDYAKNGNYYDLRISQSEDAVILFQEGHSEYGSESMQVSKGELVTVDLDLDVARGTV